MAASNYDALTGHAVAVTTTAALLTSQRAHHNRNGTLIQNHGTDVLYIGGANVTNLIGIRLAANEHIMIEGPVPIYGISIGTSSARVIEFD